MLTEKLGQVLSFIERYIGEHDGVSPTMQEIAAYLGTGSSGHAKGYVDRLLERGVLRRVPRRPRALEVLRPQVGGRELDASSEQHEHHSRYSEYFHQMETAYIELFGEIDLQTTRALQQVAVCILPGGTDQSARAAMRRLSVAINLAAGLLT